MRIENIELLKFLHVDKISEFDHLNCFYEASKQTLKHVVMDCSLMPNKNKIWWTVNDKMKNYYCLIIIFKMMKALAKWFIKTNLLSMFSLIKNQLYWKNFEIWNFEFRDDNKTTRKRRVCEGLTAYIHLAYHGLRVVRWSAKIAVANLAVFISIQKIINVWMTHRLKSDFTVRFIIGICCCAVILFAINWTQIV